jgi:hypothetical protein
VSYKRLEAPRFHKTATTQWASQIADNFDALWDDRPRISLFNGTDRSVTDDHYWTQASWSGARYEVGDWNWSPGGAFVYAPVAGLYLATLKAEWEPDTAGHRELIIANNTQWAKAAEKPESGSGYCTMSHSAVLYLNAGDVLNSGYFQNSGSSLAVRASDGAETYEQDFSAVWLGSHGL